MVTQLFVLTTMLATHGFWDLSDASHEGSSQAFLGAAFLLQVWIVGQHLFPFIDLQLRIELL